MKICCSVTIEDADLPRNGIVEWVKSTFQFKVSPCRIHFQLDSESRHASELVLRLKSSFDRMPLIFWHIEYSNTDIKNAQLLHLSCNSYIAEIARPPSVDALDLHATKALKDPRPLGGIRPFPSVIAVSRKFKGELDDAKLAGLEWIKLHARNGSSEPQTIWRMSSSFMLPASPIPVYSSFFDAPFDGDYQKGCMYRSPYREIELAYSKESIAAMEPFEIALTREHTGNYVGACFQKVVITQAFRQVLETKKNLRGLKYIPVRLLEPGEPAIRDPFEALANGAV